MDFDDFIGDEFVDAKRLEAFFAHFPVEFQDVIFKFKSDVVLLFEKLDQKARFTHDDLELYEFLEDICSGAVTKDMFFAALTGDVDSLDRMVNEEFDILFLENFHLYKDDKGKKSNFSPCDGHSYSYDVMNEHQRNWYLYFRRSVLEGSLLCTDGYYVMMLAVELLLGYGDKTPVETQKLLISLLDRYGYDFIHIRETLFVLIVDYSIYHDLDCLDLMEEDDFSLEPSERTDFLLEQQMKSDVPLSFMLLKTIMPSIMHTIMFDSALKKTNYFFLYNAVVFDAISAVDMALKSKKSGLLEHFGSARRKKVTFSLFYGVPTLDTMVKTASLKQFRTNKKLQVNLSAVLDFIELCFCEHFDVPYSGVVSSLSQEDRSLIRQVVEDMIKELEDEDNKGTLAIVQPKPDNVLYPDFRNGQD